MPNFDGTGPMGKGPMTGQGMGMATGQSPLMQGQPGGDGGQAQRLILDALQTIQMFVMEKGSPENQQAYQAFLETMAQPMGGAEQGQPGADAMPSQPQMGERTPGNVGVKEAIPVL